MADKTIHAIIEGRVQGVYFRDYTRREAEKLGLVGWVRNQRDGSVEALIAGDSGKIEKMIDWLHEGSPMANVTGITVTEHSHEDTYHDFTIRY